MSTHTINRLKKEIIDLFPDFNQEISKFLGEDENSIELVEDYLYCKKELNRLIKDNNLLRAKEFEDTHKQLEEELLEQLNALKKT